METATLSLMVSGGSAIIAITSLVLTYRQRDKQDKLATRKALTDSIALISSTNIEMSKLTGQSPPVVLLRRHLNAQRRYLSHHAALLMKQIPNLTTDVDHNLVAGAYDAAGDYESAEAHWLSCVEKSPAPALKHQNLRGLARFYFARGNPERGRQRYEEALQLPLPDTDSTRRLRADAFILWALAEREAGLSQEAQRRYQQAIGEAGRIGSKTMREDLLAYIGNVWGAEANEPKPRAKSARAPSSRGAIAK